MTALASSNCVIICKKHLHHPIIIGKIDNMKLSTAVATLFGLASLGITGATVIHPVDNDDWLHQCAQTFQTYYDPTSINIQRSNFYLIAEHSGLCADSFACAFDKCHSSYWGAEGVKPLQCLLFGNDPETNSDIPDLQNQTFDEAMQTCGVTAPLALRGSITFPKTAKDVVAAVEFAIDNGLQISIKSTGHCYTGCHTKVGFN